MHGSVFKPKTCRSVLWLLLILTLYTTLSSFVLERDSTHVNNRSIDQTKINQLKKKHPYAYGSPQQERKYDYAFFKAFSRFIDQLLGHWAELSVAFKLLRIVLFAVGIFSLLYLIIQIFNIKYLFKKNVGSGPLDYQLTNENIQEMDFGSLIQSAVQQKQFRLAVRLQYLHTLRILSELHYIDWQLNKTNFSYLIEMKDRPSSEVFVDLTNIFEWIWYGDFQIQEFDYNGYSEKFELYKKALNQKLE